MDSNESSIRPVDLPLWETCFWIDFADGRRHLAEILERRVLPERPGIVLRLRPAAHDSLIGEATMPGGPPLVTVPHPECDSRETFVGLFPEAIPLDARTGGAQDRLCLAMAGIDDSWMAPEIVSLEDGDGVAAELSSAAASLASSSVRGGRNVCSECRADQQARCDLCRREACFHRLAEIEERTYLCRACHLSLWLRGYSDWGVRVGTTEAESGRFICCADQPWAPAKSFIHLSSHPDARLTWRERPFDDLWFDHFSCPHCSVSFYSFVSK